MKRCPYCGGEIKPGAGQCPHCDRQFGQTKDESEKPSLSSMDAYQRIVPTWVFVVAVLLAVLGLVLVFVT
ncbi:MAG: hypothetical protein ACR2NP_14330 [Pirellulaceae bacterium]